MAATIALRLGYHRMHSPSPPTIGKYRWSRPASHWRAGILLLYVVIACWTPLLLSADDDLYRGARTTDPLWSTVEALAFPLGHSDSGWPALAPAMMAMAGVVSCPVLLAMLRVLGHVSRPILLVLAALPAVLWAALVVRLNAMHDGDMLSVADYGGLAGAAWAVVAIGTIAAELASRVLHGGTDAPSPSPTATRRG